jgi:hypothetical protein
VGVSPAADPLGDRLLAWIAEHPGERDRLLAEEGSRARHEEFLVAEGGMLPSRGERLARAREASGRAWLRLLALAVGDLWPPAAGRGEQIHRALMAAGERGEALALEEAAWGRRSGVADPDGDPQVEVRRVQLAAGGRTLAEAIGGTLGPDGPGGPAAGQAFAAWAHDHDDLRLRLEDEAAATLTGQDSERLAEAAAVAGAVRFWSAALGALLEDPAGPFGGLPGSR